MAKYTTAGGKDRRRFIKHVLVSIPSAVAMTSVAKARTDTVDVDRSVVSSKTREGYRETSHIRKYYEKAGF